MRTTIDFLKDVRLELSKVVWPKREEVIKLTLTIIIISAIVGVYLGALDFGFTKLLEVLISR
ncbi:preprotein translocase subunit SecE [Patescibacteria group bacterium]|nr:preprotein translocase subunit SecE [Patescibacteria group bacterium]